MARRRRCIASSERRQRPGGPAVHSAPDACARSRHAAAAQAARTAARRATAGSCAPLEARTRARAVALRCIPSTALTVQAGVFGEDLREAPRDSPYPSGSASIAFVAEATNRDCLEMDGTGA